MDALRVEPVGGQLKGLSDTLRLLPAIASVTLLVGRKRRARRALQRGLALGRGAVRGPKRVREPGGLGDGARAASFGGAAVFLATGPTQVEQVKAAAAALEGIGIGTLASAATAA